MPYKPAPPPKLTPIESEFGKALINYLISITNTHTLYLRDSLRFIEAHPREKLLLKSSEGLGILSLISSREPYETDALINYSFGIAIYATEEVFARYLREQVIAAIKKRRSTDITMPQQSIVLLKVIRQMPVVHDPQTGTELTEVEILVRLAAS